MLIVTGLDGCGPTGCRIFSYNGCGAGKTDCFVTPLLAMTSPEAVIASPERSRGAWQSVVLSETAMQKSYFLYMMTSPRKSVLYTGVTNNLAKRVFQHTELTGSTFTKKYQAKKLVYFEIIDSPYEAIRREKQIKAGSRQKKIELINRINPKWEDLSYQL